MPRSCDGPQTLIPEGGARLIIASESFWQCTTAAQDINNVRKFSAREAPLRLQAGAVRQGLRGDPTIFVVDLAPATATSGALNLQELRKQVSYFHFSTYALQSGVWSQV